VLVGETEVQICLDGSRQIAFSMSHWWCPSGSGESCFDSPFYTSRKAHRAREKAASLVEDRLFLAPFMTHRG
jgi:hypothetical protein